MPIPANALVEGYPKPGNGDRHLLVLDKDGCWLYELYHASVSKKRSLEGGLDGHLGHDAERAASLRLDLCRCSGVAGIVGLAHYHEVAASVINHALRFTVPTTRQAFVAPASHWASSTTDPNAPPMGTRLRLKASFDISGFSAANKVLLTAMKKYGLILADNGSGIYISGVGG